MWRSGIVSDKCDTVATSNLFGSFKVIRVGVNVRHIPSNVVKGVSGLVWSEIL